MPDADARAWAVSLAAADEAVRAAAADERARLREARYTAGVDMLTFERDSFAAEVSALRGEIAEREARIAALEVRCAASTGIRP